MPANLAQCTIEPSPGKHFINCGAAGRPSNDGQTTVVYTIISVYGTELLNKEFKVCTLGDNGNAYRLGVDFVRLVYDYERLGAEMTSEGLPEEFVETIRTGWWTTCNEILPAKERARGIY
jgi:hypothetical protein